MKADDIFFCPRLGARITRQACFERQSRLRAQLNEHKPSWSVPLSTLDKYCAVAGVPATRKEDPNDKCGLGAMHWRAFSRKVVTPLVRAAAPRPNVISFGRKSRPK